MLISQDFQRRHISKCEILARPSLRLSPGPLGQANNKSAQSVSGALNLQEASAATLLSHL